MYIFNSCPKKSWDSVGSLWCGYTICKDIEIIASCLVNRLSASLPNHPTSLNPLTFLGSSKGYVNVQFSTWPPYPAPGIPAASVSIPSEESGDKASRIPLGSSTKLHRQLWLFRAASNRPRFKYQLHYHLICLGWSSSWFWDCFFIKTRQNNLGLSWALHKLIMWKHCIKLATLYNGEELLFLFLKERAQTNIYLAK